MDMDSHSLQARKMECDLIIEQLERAEEDPPFIGYWGEWQLELIRKRRDWLKEAVKAAEDRELGKA